MVISSSQTSGMLQLSSPPPPPSAAFHLPLPMPPHTVPVDHHMPMGNQHLREQHVEVAVVKKDTQKQHKNHCATSSKNRLSEEATLKILNQVEYYFSDFNLATGNILMRFINKDPEGYVPISFVASFKKIKALITTQSQLATVLQQSSKLVVSEDGKKVRRWHPLTESDIEKLQSRIIVAENLPEDHCHQNLMKLFSAVGSVKTIRTCHPQPSGGVASSASRSAKSDGIHFSNKLHAFVEYESVEGAEKAIAELNDDRNCRSCLRVRLMPRCASKPAHGKVEKGHDGVVQYEEDDASRSNEKQEDPLQLSSHSKEYRINGNPIVTQGSRRALQLFKNTITSSSNHLSSSSGSIEAPRGCLGFLLSCSSSSTTTTTTTTTATTKTPLSRNCPTTTTHFISKTPKSALGSRLPHSKPLHFIKKNSLSKPISHKLYRVKKSQSSKKSTSETPAFMGSDNAASVIESLSVSRDLLKLPEELKFTPVAVSKIATCSTVDCLFAGIGYHKNIDDDKSNTSSSNSKTPPIQASFSPEIQSTTTTTTETTPACYGAGHLISGVTDKRKCRARGLLAVALPGTADNNMSSNDSNNIGPEDAATAFGNKSSVSMFPLPAEASMHWLLSPCREDNEDDKENSSPLHGLVEHKALHSPSSPLSDLGFSLDWSNFDNNTNDDTNSSTGKSQRSRNNMLISTQVPQFQVRLDSLCDYTIASSSPNATPYSGAFPLKEETKCFYNIDGDNSPFSAETLGSENVMQTPKSESSLERHVGMSSSSAKDHKRQHLHAELLSTELISMVGDLRMASLSPESHVSIWDTNGSSFQFDCLTTPSNSVDLSQFQKKLDDQSLWTSTSTFENVSQSQMRISWREGLESRIFEMDEFDSCRCLSDEEEDLNVNSSDLSKSCRSLEFNVDARNVPTLEDACGSTEFPDAKSKEKLQSPVQCSYAESVSTDAGVLARSEDSDWNLFYKNNLFEV